MATSDELARFSAWLTRFGDGWESGSADRIGEAFVVGATFQPTPFEPLLRGRRAIRDWYGAQLASWEQPSFAAQVLGVGETYGVAHFRIAAADRALDGVMVVALDGRGRCSSLRQWWHTGDGNDASAAEGTSRSDA